MPRLHYQQARARPPPLAPAQTGKTRSYAQAFAVHPSGTVSFGSAEVAAPAAALQSTAPARGARMLPPPAPHAAAAPAVAPASAPAAAAPAPLGNRSFSLPTPVTSAEAAAASAAAEDDDLDL